MAFKQFTPEEVQSTVIPSIETKSISEDSPSANHVHFFTGISSLGKINYFNVNIPKSFGLTEKINVQYNWKFDKNPVSSITAERVVGSYLSASAGEEYQSSTRDNSAKSHQSIYNHIQGYLYRADKNFLNSSLTSLRSTSTASDISVARMIMLRRDIYNSAIEPNSLRIEMNSSNTSATGLVTNTTTSFTTALSLKNTFGGDLGTSINSFFGVPWTESTSLDTATSALTIEAVIRPYNKNCVLLWRRLSSSGWAGSTIESQNSFMKLELVRSPNTQHDAFRFYIRSVTSEIDFTEDFARTNTQTSGLFIPNDVGINLYDGKFHHIMVTWSISGLGDSLTTESGAGAVLGYVDGYKLLNREEVDPRLQGADHANGPTVQSNMFNQRIPLRTTAIQYTDPEDPSPSGNNLYIGTSNYNRDKDDATGDRGDLASSADANLVGGYDGEIQHVRMWKVRFSDGTTGLADRTSLAITDTSTAGISFSNFRSFTGSSYSTNMIAWWEFNERNTLSANDISPYSNTGSVVGRGNINLYDYYDSTKSVNVETEQSASSIFRTYLYTDSPEPNIIYNDLRQGRLIRRTCNGLILPVGVVYYDLGLCVFDNSDYNAQLNFLWPASGTTGDFGFSVTGNNNAAFNIERVAFNSIDNKGRAILKATASGTEYNYTQNQSASNPETEKTLTDDPTTYITSVGLYNDMGDLVAIGKLSVPVKKDESRQLTTNIAIDF